MGVKSGLFRPLRSIVALTIFKEKEGPRLGAVTERKDGVPWPGVLLMVDERDDDGGRLLAVPLVVTESSGPSTSNVRKAEEASMSLKRPSSFGK